MQIKHFGIVVPCPVQHVSSKHEYLLVCGKLKVWKLYIGCQSDMKQEYIWPCMTNNHVQWMVLIVSLCLQCLIVACMWPGTWQAGWLDWLKFCVCRLFPEIWCSDNRPTYTIADEPLSVSTHEAGIVTVLELELWCHQLWRVVGRSG